MTNTETLRSVLSHMVSGTLAGRDFRPAERPFLSEAYERGLVDSAALTPPGRMVWYLTAAGFRFLDFVVVTVEILSDDPTALLEERLVDLVSPDGTVSADPAAGTMVVTCARRDLDGVLAAVRTAATSVRTARGRGRAPTPEAPRA